MRDMPAAWAHASTKRLHVGETLPRSSSVRCSAMSDAAIQAWAKERVAALLRRLIALSMRNIKLPGLK